MGIVLRYFPEDQQQKHKTNRKDELLSGNLRDYALHPGAGILQTLLQPLQTLQECLHQPGLRLEVLHTGGRSHSRWIDRGGHQRPGTSDHIRSHQRGLRQDPKRRPGGLLEDVPALTEILLRHVVPKNIVKLYKAEMSYDNAGGSKVTVDGYSVSTSSASAQVTGKVTATDGMVYAIDTVI